MVMGFRDWGLDRLVAAVRAHKIHAPRSAECEVIVSDYGSADAKRVKGAVESAGGRVVRNEVQGPWSRSAALNAGVEAAQGDVIITTDADIIFNPVTYRAAMEQISRNENILALVQCRDLPETWTSSRILQTLDKEGELDFDELRRVSSVRPRWGMGGFAAFSKKSFYSLNGYEERMKVWGKEDNDYAIRFRRMGMPLRWLSQVGCEIYHIWHAPSLQKANESTEGALAVKQNQEILEFDKSIVRNLPSRFRKNAAFPAVSVVIATYNRREKLHDALTSCLRQTFQNFEVVVVENGKRHGAEEVVSSFNDSRLKYIFSPVKGAAAARNLGTRHARGRYIVIQDDDDIMVGTRLEAHLRALREGDHGTYGGWMDFDEETGEIVSDNPGKELALNSLLFSGKVLIHPGVMMRRDVLEAFPYDETRSAGIDYALFLKLVRSGLKLSHTGEYAILRRIHATNMTKQMAEVQKESADLIKMRVLGEIPRDARESSRAEGKAAQILECSNREAALKDLALFAKSGQKQARVITLNQLAVLLGGKVDDESLKEALIDRKLITSRGGEVGLKGRYLAERAKYLALTGALAIEVEE